MKKKNQIKKERNRGITLIALVITIIVLLILAAVSIATLTGENGILTQATKAGDRTTEETEKEEIKLSFNAAKSKKYEEGDYTGKVTASELDTELKKQDKDTEVTPNSDPIEVKFKNTGNIYTVTQDGTVNIEKQNGSSDNGVDYSELSLGDYVNYPVYYDNVEGQFYNKDDYTASVDMQKINEKYNGWKIISVDNENKVVKLISSGIPVDFRSQDEDDSNSDGLNNDFFDIEITSDSQETIFENCEFKTGKNGNKITKMKELKDLFLNGLTKTETSSLDGKMYPKVTCFNLREDTKYITGGGDWWDFTDIVDELWNPFCGIENGCYWVLGDTGWPYSYFRGYEFNTCNSDASSKYGEILGVRPVVTLKANLKFTQANNSESSVKTWNISN